VQSPVAGTRLYREWESAYRVLNYGKRQRLFRRLQGLTSAERDGGVRRLVIVLVVVLLLFFRGASLLLIRASLPLLGANLGSPSSPPTRLALGFVCLPLERRLVLDVALLPVLAEAGAEEVLGSVG